MTDVPARLGAALSDRYRVERELGEGGMATALAADVAEATGQWLQPGITSSGWCKC